MEKKWRFLPSVRVWVVGFWRAFVARPWGTTHLRREFRFKRPGISRFNCGALVGRSAEGIEFRNLTLLGVGRGVFENCNVKAGHRGKSVMATGNGRLNLSLGGFWGA